MTDEAGVRTGWGLLGRASKLLPRSLTLRVIALSTVWAVLVLLVIATFISTLFRQASERGFESLLSAHLFNLISSVSLSEQGMLLGNPNLGDLRFTEANSGWYWAVEPVSESVIGELRSVSMTAPIASPPAEQEPFDADFQRSYVVTGLVGEELEVIEAEFVLDNQNRVARFRMMGNRTELEEEIEAFERSLYTYLAIFGAGMIAINVFAILLGLKPLGRVRKALSDIREGNAQQLDGEFPAEIAPLAEETNALIDSNRRIVERARTQVGNLAHSLKTPLAIMLNEGRAIGGEKGALLVEQAGSMQQQLDHYLQRARIAAQRDSVVFRTPVVETLDRLVRVVRKINPGIDLRFERPAEEIIFSGEREDLEEIVGNLLENAVKWANGKVRVSVRPAPERPDGPSFDILIEDDGPGIPEEKARDALKRGRRLDETKPGTGLGLSIVSDLVKEYGGQLQLGQSEIGGLRVAVTLRRSAL